MIVLLHAAGLPIETFCQQVSNRPPDPSATESWWSRGRVRCLWYVESGVVGEEQSPATLRGWSAGGMGGG